LELSKPVLWDDSGDPLLKIGTRHTLVNVLEETLRMSHPLLPFITEEIWHNLAPFAGIKIDESSTIMLQPYPEINYKKIDESALLDIEWLKKVILGVRNIRGEMNISPGKPLKVLFAQGDNKDRLRIEENSQFLSKLANLESITFLNSAKEAPFCATALAGELEILVPLGDLIDVDSELSRLDREIRKISMEITKLAAKLDNNKFIDNAPSAIVEKEKKKLDESQQTLFQLKRKHDAISDMS
jgi:valyl-tRNA synthetase